MANFKLTAGDAMAFLRNHYHTPILTAEGILVQAEVVIADKVTRYQDDQDDNWYEEPMVFPIVDGLVAGHDVKAWLGY